MNRIFFFIGFLILASVLSNAVSAAIMVSPGSYHDIFQPDSKKDYSFTFFVDDNALLQVYAGGDFSNYVHLDTKEIQGQGSVIATVQLPSSVDIPGLHVITVAARQIPAQGQQGFGLIGNVVGQILIFVPYPGQYLSFDFSSKNANAGEPVTFSGSLDNLGKEDVNANVFVDVYLNDTKVKEVSIGDYQINASDKIDFSQDMDTTGMVPGNYQSTANLIYGDNHLIQKNSSFRLGELKVELTNYTRTFERNKINRMELQVVSQWNDNIPAVYANVSLVGYPVHFLTPTISLDGFNSGVLTGFFDTTGLNDSFDADVSVNYAGKYDTQRVHLSLQNQTNYTPIILAAAIFVVILFIVIVTILLRRRKRGKKR